MLRWATMKRIDLVPQDELTQDLLAQVLASMFLEAQKRTADQGEVEGHTRSAASTPTEESETMPIILPEREFVKTLVG
jgi:hypothetical protein